MRALYFSSSLILLSGLLDAFLRGGMARDRYCWDGLSGCRAGKISRGTGRMPFCLRGGKKSVWKVWGMST